MITPDAITDEDLKEAIADLDTEICVLQAALKIKTGKYARQMREGAAEILNARAARATCDFRSGHDEITDLPTGNRCGKAATHRIDWEDGRRYSFGCDEHLEIHESASVKPARSVPLDANTAKERP